MIEVTGDLWEYEADARVITTNGTIKENGRAVMGKGCAKEAADRVNRMTLLLGEMLQQEGNNVHHFYSSKVGHFFSFPVKHNWWENADPLLIKRSAEQLVIRIDRQIDDNIFTSIVMPRPGCGNGHLDWNFVKPVIEPILDDRFHVITFA